MSLVELRDAEVTYRRAGRPFVALHGIDLQVGRGGRIRIDRGAGAGATTGAALGASPNT